ncbi:MAG: tetratricopeptide repeat protein [Rhodospirillales bacterium]
MSKKKRRVRNTAAKKPAKKPETNKPRADLKAALNAAARLYRGGRLKQAQEACGKILRVAPEHFGTLYLLGAVATRLGDSALAADSFAKAAAADPANAEALVNLGLAQKNLGKPDEAIASFRRALEIKPGIAEAHNALGKVLQDQNRTLEDPQIAEEALACFQRAVEIKPEYAEAHNNLGMELGNQEKLDEAAACYRRAVELNPAYAEAHNNLGNVLRHQKKLDEAVACYQRVVDLNPKFAIAHNNLGKALKGLDRLDEAAASCRRARKIDPRHMDTHITLAGILEAQDKPDKAEASYRRALKIEPDNWETLHSLGNVLKDQEKLDEAAAALERALEINPDAAETHNSLGIVRKHQEKVEEAVACYRRSIELLPDNAEAHNNLGNALKDQDKTDEAIACYQKAMEYRENFAEAHCNLAKVHTFVPGDPEIETLKELFDLEEVSADNKNHLLIALGKAHDDIGAYDEAFAYYQRANEETAKERPFNAPGHRRRIRETMRLCAAPRGREPGNLADVKQIPVFVIGMSRSGKTLVESLLAQDDAVYAAGESHEWAEAIKGVLKKYSIPARFPAYTKVLSAKQKKELGEAYMAALSSLSPESRFFVNTMPSNYPFVGMIFEACPAARVIYCRRDAFDNCLTSFFYRYKNGNGYSYDLQKAGSFYVDYQEMMTHWRSLYGDRVYPVRYEELVRNPAEVVPGIFKYCGLEYDPAAIDIDFNTDEIGCAKNYESQLDPLRQVLGKWAE